MLQMKVGESVNEYFARTLTIANKKQIHGEKMDDVAVIEKILRSMTPKFDYVVCAIDESNDVETMSIDELQSSLLVHEQRMNYHTTAEEHALKVTWSATAAMNWGISSMNAQRKDSEQTLLTQVKRCC